MNNRRRGRRTTITINTRVKENPGEFRIDNGILFCNFCDHSVDWIRKSTVDDHLNSKTHKAKKNLKHCKEGAAIPQAATLRQLYNRKIAAECINVITEIIQNIVFF
nr:13704_t:CDS:2 [Entrophospora candida]